MVTVGDVYYAIDCIAPFSTAEKWDNCGLLVGGFGLPAERVLLALDLTAAVLQEAAQIHAQLVVTHHPVIFSPLARLDSGCMAYRAAAAGVSVVSAHTNLDFSQGGVNDALAARLSLGNVRPLQPQGERNWLRLVVFVPEHSAQQVFEAMCEAGAGAHGEYSHVAFFARGQGRYRPRQGAMPYAGKVGALETAQETRLELLCPPSRLEPVLSAMKSAHPYEQPVCDILENRAITESLSLGRVGELEMPLATAPLAAFVKDRLGAAGVRYTAGAVNIATVAVCGGSGANLLADARQAGAQALVTGEAKHSQWLQAAELGITLIDAGHFATENVVMEPLCIQLAQFLPAAQFSVSHTCTDGVQYSL